MVQDYIRFERLKEIAKEIRKCKKCRLYEKRRNTVPGEGPVTAEIMLCGQAPGRNEDKTGRPFVGMAGKFLDNLLKSNQLNRENLFITSPIKCFPPENRSPRSDELKSCKPYLLES